MRTLVLAGALTALLGCSDAIDDDVARLYPLTIPPGAAATELEREDLPAERVITWRVTTGDWLWPQYSNWVVHQLRDEFASVIADKRSLQFRKVVSGDSYTLTVLGSEAPAARSVTLTLITRPF